MLHSLRLRLLLLALMATVCLSVHAQQNSKRLVLKDGSYQTATQWEVKGDRVRYYSTERFTWEELPKDLVDWPATEKYNAEHQKGRMVSAEALAKDEEADRRAEDAQTPQVAPGLRLPDGGGVFLMDTFQTQPQLVELIQNGSELNKHTGKNILRAAINPLALSTKQTIELKGEHARIQAHGTQPVFYVNLDADTSVEPAAGTKDGAKDKDTDQRPDRYRIVRVEQKKDTRVVGNLSIAIYGKVSEKENWIKTVTSAMGDWVKVEPAQPLPEGEYALVEMLGKKQVNLYVWDFGVNPAAPANATAWVPRQPAQTKTGTNDSPVLNKRPPKN